jgi:hypothetical protein
MVDRKSPSYRDRAAVGRQQSEETSRRGMGLRLADLAWLSGQNDPCANRSRGANISGLNSSSAETGDAYSGDDLYDVLAGPRSRSLAKGSIGAGCGGAGGRGVHGGRIADLPATHESRKWAQQEYAQFGQCPTERFESKASAGASAKFASRWLADIQKQPKTALMSSNLSASPRYGPGSGATQSPATPLWAAPSSQPKKIRTVRIRSDGSVQPEGSTEGGRYNSTTTTAPQANPGGAATAPPIGSQPSSPAPEGKR